MHCNVFHVGRSGLFRGQPSKSAHARPIQKACFRYLILERAMSTPSIVPSLMHPNPCSELNPMHKSSPYRNDLQRKNKLRLAAGGMDGMPVWTLDQIAGLAFGVRGPYRYG